MKQPLETTIDHEVGAAYVAYAPIGPGDVARTERVNHDVHADFDSSGALLGIEVLALDDAALSVACDYAAKIGVAFPDQLSGARST
jgi:uncharacterized protein YuzE